MARVFLSHASEDVELACELHAWLVDQRHTVFLDRDLRHGLAVGEDWERRLHERLRWADAVLCIITSAYVKSTWCAAEVGVSRSRGSRLLPVVAEPGVVHPLLPVTQYADYADDPGTARAEVAEALRRIDVAGGLGWPEGRNPFPGLRAFDADLHSVFFGRAGETQALAGLLRSPAERADGQLLLVVGPSGCGKSSLVRAGLLPVMADEPGWWTLPPLVPGADPVGALAHQLAARVRQLGVGWTVTQVRERLDHDDRALVVLAEELLLAAPDSGRRHRLLVVVDQFEELLTQANQAGRARFAELLRPTLAGPVQVVGTLRPEFFDQLLASEELAGLPVRTFPLRPLRRDALHTVIEAPADRASIAVDGELVDRLVSDTDSGQALPLLAFTLAQLADGVARGGQLSSARYDQLGGVQGALTRQAEAALAEAVAGGHSRTEVVAALLRLVTVDEQGRPTRWRVNHDQLPAAVAGTLDPFVDRRLVTTDTDNGAVVVEVAHEAFLAAWPPLAATVRPLLRRFAHGGRWSRPPPGVPTAGSTLGCGNAASLPPLSPTSACTSSPPADLTDSLRNRRVSDHHQGGCPAPVGCWWRTRSISAHRPLTSCMSACVRTAAAVGAPPPSCQCCSSSHLPRPVWPSPSSTPPRSKRRRPNGSSGSPPPGS